MLHFRILCILVIFYMTSADHALKEACLKGDLIYGHCRCKSMQNFYSYTGHQLACQVSFDYVQEVVRSIGDSTNFIGLSISAASSNHVSHHNFSGFLEYAKNLRYLSLENNGISSIGQSSFQHLVNLLYLDLSRNQLYAIETNWFVGLGRLQHLVLADNNIVTLKLDPFHYLKSLIHLDLSKNDLTDREISAQSFFRLNNLTSLSLAENQLKTLDKDVFMTTKDLKVNLTGNPWVCDTKLLPLRDWLRLHESDKAQCNEPPDLMNSTLQIGLLVVYLEIEVERNSICNASMCNCTVSKDKQIVTIDCNRRRFMELPRNLPYKTRVLDLRNNFIESLNLDHVNATQWADVSFLHLNNNLITSLKGLEGTWLLRNLVALHLTNNRLTEIPIHILEQFRGGLLDELYLSGNPWNCDCNTVRFQTWLQDNFKTVKDFDNIRCSPDSGVYSKQQIFNLLKSQLCPQHVQLVNYLDVLNGLMAVAIVMIVLKLSYDFWLQKRTGKLPRFFSLNLSQ